jgi:hypothetical protein
MGPWYLVCELSGGATVKEEAAVALVNWTP